MGQQDFGMQPFFFLWHLSLKVLWAIPAVQSIPGDVQNWNGDFLKGMGATEGCLHFA